MGRKFCKKWKFHFLKSIFWTKMSNFDIFAPSKADFTDFPKCLEFRFFKTQTQIRKPRPSVQKGALKTSLISNFRDLGKSEIIGYTDRFW